MPELTLPPKRDLRIARVEHPSIPADYPAFNIFEGRDHIGSFRRDEYDDRWCAQKMHRGLPYAERWFATREEAETFAAQR